jgi:hypothetical protein
MLVEEARVNMVHEAVVVRGAGTASGFLSNLLLLNRSEKSAKESWRQFLLNKTWWTCFP